jgi:AcrR family transcriptional regulator
VSATRVARELNVTTGSFYWYFVSVAEFHEALQEYWREEVVVGVAREAQQRANGDPANVLEELRQVILEKGTHLYDSAMRQWAKTNGDAERVVQLADEWRQATMTEFLRAAGMAREEARDRIHLVGAAWRGSGGMDPEHRMKLGRRATSKN